jgi:hypothetical protein
MLPWIPKRADAIDLPFVLAPLFYSHAVLGASGDLAKKKVRLPFSFEPQGIRVEKRSYATTHPSPR